MFFYFENLCIIDSSSGKNFENILEYLYTEWGNKVVNQFIGRIDKLLNHLASNPKQFPLISKKRRVRKSVISKHNTLFHKERRENIDILRIFDTRQNPNKVLYNK